MYKSKLQELVHKKRLELPVYHTVKKGPDHMPRFSGTVTVQDQVFRTPEDQKSAKEAENTAARIAFEHLSVPPPVAPPQPQTDDAPLPIAAPPPVVYLFGTPIHVASPPPEMQPPSPSLPTPISGLLDKNDANTKPDDGEVLQKNNDDVQIGSHDKGYEAGLTMYKNQLQQYAQKNNLCFPEYTTESHGPPHDSRFKSKVCVDGKIYETPEFFSTLKEAEQAAAKVACQALSVAIIQEDVGFHKNLLQELAQKKGLHCPLYKTVGSGMGHMPIFESVVTIGANTFRGAEAKSKKQAEVNAAKAAYSALTKGYAVTNSSTVSAVNESTVAGNSSRNIQHTTTIRRHLDTTDEGPSGRAKRAKVN